MESRSVRRSLLLFSRAAHHLLLRHNYNKPSLSSNPLSDQIQTRLLSSSSFSFTISNHNLLFFSHSRSFCSSFEPSNPTTVLLFDDTTSHEYRVQWFKEQHEYLLKEGWRLNQIRKCWKRREQWLEKGQWRKLDDVSRMEQREKWLEEQREHLLWNDESQQWCKKQREQYLKELIGLREKRAKSLMESVKMEDETIMELVEEMLKRVKMWEKMLKNNRELVEMDYDVLKSKDIDWIYYTTMFHKKKILPEVWNSIQQDGEDKESSDEGDSSEIDLE